MSPRLPFDINFNQTSIRIDGKTYDSDTARRSSSPTWPSHPTTSTTLGVPIVEGRGFTAADREGAPLVAIVNETMARRFWPDGSAVGRTFTMTFGKKQYQVVGVAGNHRVNSVGERPTPYLHFAAAQQPATYNTIRRAHARRCRGSCSPAMRRELLAMEPGLVFIRHETMEASMATSLLPRRVGAMLAGGFGGLGTLLAAIGLYGVIAFSVARRTREIGIRMALGAQPGRVLGLVMRQGLTLLAIWRGRRGAARRGRGAVAERRPLRRWRSRSRSRGARRLAALCASRPRCAKLHPRPPRDARRLRSPRCGSSDLRVRRDRQTVQTRTVTRAARPD